LNTNPILTPNNNFQTFGLEHAVSTIIFIVIGFALIRWALKQPSKKQDQVFVLLSVVLIATNLIWIGLQFLVNDFNYKQDLPEVLLFWTMTFVLLALVTPGIVDSFPHFHFIKYWITHAGIMIFILYATFVYGMRPTLKSVFKSFFAIQIYLIAVYLVNAVLGSNYFYLNEKPPIDTLLDKFGDWPNYIFVIELMLIPVFLLIYLPFYFLSKNKG